MRLFYIDRGAYFQRHISESQTIRDSERFRFLSAFSTGIEARKLDAQGFRTIEDLELHHGNIDSEEFREDAVERSTQVFLSLRKEFSLK